MVNGFTKPKCCRKRRLKVAASACLFLCSPVASFTLPTAIQRSSIGTKSSESARSAIDTSSLDSLEDESFTRTTMSSKGLPFSPLQVTTTQRWRNHLEALYDKALGVKCPFFRRRISDVLDLVDHAFLHMTQLDIPPLSHRCQGETCEKLFDLSREQLRHYLLQDWKISSGKGYYVTGKVNTLLYRDDCLFTGPDPDMPIHGLRKYLNAVSQLFDPAKSTCNLLSLQAVPFHNRIVLQARWQMNARLRLPWKPWIPTVTGTTRYHQDSNGLIYKHEEEWDLSVWEAFVHTFAPSFQFES